MILESIGFFIQELASSIAYKIANNINHGKSQGIRIFIQFLVFTFLLIALLIVLGWLAIQLFSWLSSL